MVSAIALASSGCHGIVSNNLLHNLHRFLNAPLHQLLEIVGVAIPILWQRKRRFIHHLELDLRQDLFPALNRLFPNKEGVPRPQAFFEYPLMDIVGGKEGPFRSVLRDRIEVVITVRVLPGQRIQAFMYAE